METPSSTTRRITRSQTNSIKNTSRKMEDSESILSKSKQLTSKSKQDRSVLIDITNDSPIVGVAASGSLETPISALAKQRSSRCKRTPGSGEALLRGQVKNLLQKVEEEAEISKFSLPSGDDRPLIKDLKAFLNSPAGLLAPTPANTPLILNFSALDEVESFGSVSPAPIEDQLIVSQVMSGILGQKKEVESGSSESEKDLITRSLFLDFSEKSEASSDCSSVVTYQGTGSQEKAAPVEDDDASVWSIQVNASTRGEDEDEDEVIDDEVEGDIYDNEDEYDGEEEEEDESLLLDDLCEGISNINVNGEKGKHKRFVYNSDDELVEERDVLHLKGLPTPEGKHLRFQDEQ